MHRENTHTRLFQRHMTLVRRFVGQSKRCGMQLVLADPVVVFVCLDTE